MNSRGLIAFPRFRTASCPFKLAHWEDPANVELDGLADLVGKSVGCFRLAVLTDLFSLAVDCRHPYFAVAVQDPHRDVISLTTQRQVDS